MHTNNLGKRKKIIKEVHKGAHATVMAINPGIEVILKTSNTFWCRVICIFRRWFYHNITGVQ